MDKGIIEAVIFDLGGVVFGISLDRVIQTWAKFASCDPNELTSRFKIDESYELFEVGKLSPKQYRAHVCDLLKINLSDEEFDMGWNSIYLDLLPGIKPLLEQLQHNMRLVVLTNTNAIHAPEWRIRYRDILKYFEKIFASHEIGARKPYPESFNIILDYLNLPSEKVAFFDDNASNVDGAKFVGIKGFVVNSPQEVLSIFQKYI